MTYISSILIMFFTFGNLAFAAKKPTTPPPKGISRRTVICSIALTAIGGGALWYAKTQKGSKVDDSPGFFPLNNSSIPEGVRKAADSTFRIGKFSSKPLFEIERKHYDAAISDLSSLKGGFRDQVMLEDLKKAKKENKATCPVTYMNHASGFLGEDGTFWMARHSLIKELKAFPALLAEKFTPKELESRLYSEELPVAIALYDSAGNIVFDTRNGTDKVFLKSFLTENKVPEGLEKKIGWQAAQLGDWVQLRLNRKIDRPGIPVRKSKVEVGEAVYGLGFPDRTETRFRSNTPDSDGISLRVTKGKAVTAEQGSRQQDIAKSRDRSGLLVDLDKYFLFHTADLATGASGGPLVDSEGRLIGQLLIKYNGDSKQDIYSRTGVFTPRRDIVEGFAR